MTNQCAHGQLARVCELCEKDAEIAQLRQYLDTAQRRASALSAVSITMREWIKDTGLQADICTRNILGEVCSYCQCGRAARKGAT